MIIISLVIFDNTIIMRIQLGYETNGTWAASIFSQNAVLPDNGKGNH